MTNTDKILQNIAQTCARYTIKAEICEVCGTTEGQLNRHHHNYKKLTDVIILCLSCHAEIHSFDSFNYKRKRIRTVSKEQIEKEGEILYNFNFLPCKNES